MRRPQASTGPTEDQIQKSLIDWAKLCKFQGQPLVNFIHHSPNGGKRESKVSSKGKRYSPEAAKLKAMGTLNGMPDLFIFISKGGYNGLFVELKKPKGRVSEIQQARINTLNEQGYHAVVCWGFDGVQGVIKDYIKGNTVKQVSA